MEISAENKFRVGTAIYSTGIVLKKDGEEFFNNQEDIETDMYHNFEDFESAKIFAMEKVNENPKIECWIIDDSKKYLFTFDLNGERK